MEKEMEAAVFRVRGLWFLRVSVVGSNKLVKVQNAGFRGSGFRIWSLGIREL